LKKVKKRKKKKKKKKKKDPCEVYSELYSDSEFPELITLNVKKIIFYTKTNVFLRKYEIVGKIK